MHITLIKLNIKTHQFMRKILVLSVNYLDFIFTNKKFMIFIKCKFT